MCLVKEDLDTSLLGGVQNVQTEPMALAAKSWWERWLRRHKGEKMTSPAQVQVERVSISGDWNQKKTMDHSCLHAGPPEAEPETRTGEQTAYWGRGPKKLW